MTFPGSVVFPLTTKVNDKGNLDIGGCDLPELVAKYGSPLYLFDEATLRNRCRAFTQGFGQRYPKTRVLYASKAFINRGLAQIFRDEDVGLDVVSGGELAVAQAAELSPKNVYFHGNNKGPQELCEALDWGIGCVVVDGFSELELLDRLARERQMVQDILLRVSPGVDPHTHVHTTTGILDSKFGFPLQTGQARLAVLQAIKAKGLRLRGLHMHLGSPIFETEPYERGTRLLLEFAATVREEGFEFEEFSPGGGFAIAYVDSDRPPSVATYAEAFIKALKDGCRDFGLPEPLLTIEPGRAIVGPAGVAIYTVGATKDIPGVRRYVSVDGGMGDNIRPALYEARYSAVVANKVEAPSVETVTIAGKFCESGDVLVKDIALPSMKPGDLIAIPASGAYAPAMASNYNLAPRPAIVLVENGRARVLRRRETYQDLMRYDVV